MCCAVDVGVRHDDHAVVAELLEVELVADTRADGGDHRLDLGVREHLVDPVLLGVDHLAAQRQDRLEERSRASFAEPPAESPSTRKSSADSGSLIWQSASLPGSDALSSALLRRVSSRALRAACRAWRAAIAFWMICRASAVVLLEELRELLVHGCARRGPPPPGFRASSSSGPRTAGSRSLTEMHRREPLADVLALEVVLLLLQQALRAGVMVERPCERRS